MNDEPTDSYCEVFSEQVAVFAATIDGASDWMIRKATDRGTAIRLRLDGRCGGAAVANVGHDAVDVALKIARQKAGLRPMSCSLQRQLVDCAPVTDALPDNDSTFRPATELERDVREILATVGRTKWYFNSQNQSVGIASTKGKSTRFAHDVRQQWGLSVDLFVQTTIGPAIRLERHLSATRVPRESECAAFKSLLLEVSHLAKDISRARQIDEGNYTVLFAGPAAGLLLHEAFGHLIEECPQRRPIWEIGSQIAPEYLSICDDATFDGLFGSRRIDDAGTAARKISLLRRGYVMEHLTSTLGEEAGCIRRANFRHAPDVVADLKRGIQVTRIAHAFVEHHTGIVKLFVGEAYTIERGIRSIPLIPFVLEAAANDILNNIHVVCSDIQTLSMFCQSGPAPIPAAVGAPSCLCGPLRARIATPSEYQILMV
jgi:predicted Zn-dependent protease